MELVLLNKDDSKKQQDLLKLMGDEGILPAEASDGICFTLTLHTIEKYIRNLNSLDQAKQESFPVKYIKVYDHCLKSDSKWNKHCRELIEEFNKYYAQYTSGKGQTDIIRDTIADCGFGAALSKIRIEEHKSKTDASADLESVLENHGSVAVLLCMNAENEHGKSIGHTAALVRDGQSIYYLDVSKYMIEAATANGSTEKKKYTVSKFLNEKILVDLANRNILNVTYAVILP